MEHFYFLNDEGKIEYAGVFDSFDAADAYLYSNKITAVWVFDQNGYKDLNNSIEIITKEL